MGAMGGAWLPEQEGPRLSLREREEGEQFKFQHSYNQLISPGTSLREARANNPKAFAQYPDNDFFWDDFFRDDLLILITV